MIELIKQKALEQGIKLAIVPTDCILDVKADMEKLVQDNKAVKAPKWITEEKYTFNSTEIDFQPQSIIVAVWKLKLAEVVFRYKGRETSCIIEDSFAPAKEHDIVKDIFAEQGYHLHRIPWIPHKCIAVRSGLCEYGRNNIAYSDDWGSFIRIGTYISDIAAENYLWRDDVDMTFCDTCKKCVKNCPTKAILPNRFLIDYKICLANLNCSDDRDIPEWVPKSVHHCLIECTRCQDICPLNQERLKNMERIDFDENETEIMLKSESFSDFPENIRIKLWHYNTGNQFKCIPRNLRLMLDKN